MTLSWMTSVATPELAMPAPRPDTLPSMTLLTMAIVCCAIAVGDDAAAARVGHVDVRLGDRVGEDVVEGDA